MKIKSNYKLCQIAGVPIIVKQVTREVDFTHVISLNKSAKFLYEHFLGKDFESEDVQTYWKVHLKSAVNVQKRTLGFGEIP